MKDFIIIVILFIVFIIVSYITGWLSIKIYKAFKNAKTIEKVEFGLYIKRKKKAKKEKE